MYRSKILWSLAGLFSTPLAAFFFIPLLLSRIDNERFGMIALAWTLLSYASALDLGIGRATTQYVSALRGKGDLAQIPPAIDVAWRLSITYSAIGVALFLVAVGFDVESLITYRNIGAQELKIATIILIFTLPVQVLSALYRGIIEAFEDFRVPSIVRMYLGVANFVAPMLVSLFSQSLVPLVASILISRAVGLFMLYFNVRKKMHALRTRLGSQAVQASTPAQRRSIRVQLNRFGKWMTVSNIAHPLLMQSDRFIIASAISAAAVTAYYIPNEIILQSTMIASAITNVMFPMLTARLQHDAGEGHRIFVMWRNRLLLISAAMYIVLCLAFPTILQFWMGDKVGPESATLGRIICLGAFFYTVSVIYTSYLHAQSRVRACATIQLIELAVYIPALYLSARFFGLQGAAICWVARAIFDAVALAWVSRRPSATPAPAAT